MYERSKDISTVDAFSQPFAQVDPADVIGINDALVRKCGEYKSLNLVRIDGFRGAAMDGTGLFSIASPRLGKDGH